MSPLTTLSLLIEGMILAPPLAVLGGFGVGFFAAFLLYRK